MKKTHHSNAPVCPDKKRTDYTQLFEELAEKEGWWNCDAWVKQMEIIAWNISLQNGHEIAFTYWHEFAPHDRRKFSEFFKDEGVTPEELSSEEKRDICKLRGIGTVFGKPNFRPFWEWNFIRPTSSYVFFEKQKAEQKRKKEEHLRKYGETRTMKPQRYWGD